ncbi:CAP domain-containing protein [Micromonospora fluostatini]
MNEQSGASKAAVIGGLILLALVLLGAPPALLIGGAFVLVMSAIYILLLPLILLIMLFTGGGSPAFDVNQAAEESITASRGDGKGELDPAQIPVGLRDTLEDAGETCGEIGPVVIAAQIEVESAWYAAKVGEDGRLGISQLTPEIFDEYGEDTDDNDETSALDPEDSIMAQATYMCDLADDVQQLLDDNQAIGDPLDLTLAAYRVGIDAVREAGGIPPESDAQEYVVRVRAYFAKYMGIIGPPHETPTTSGPGGAAGGGDEAPDEARDGDEPEESPPSGQAQQVLGLVNTERAGAGCPAVRTEGRLTTAAQRHSQDQADHRNMSHTGSDGSTVGDRLDRAGYSWSTYGENVAINRASPEAVMEAWMNSPGHRANILNCAFTELGVGMVTRGDQTYWTQKFAAPR